MAKNIDISQPFRLLPDFKERVWGVGDLANWFPQAPAKTIGEAWFTAEENQTSSYVIEAQPGAEVALGFREQISPERMRAAAESGEIEQLLDWKPVQAGDVVFVPAGTVHAIGAGLTVFEIQQNSDITYRLYDYGRPRELHLDHGCEVSDLGPYLHRFDRKQLGAGRLVVAESPYFRIEHLCQSGKNGMQFGANVPHYSLLISLGGKGTISGQPFERGQVWLLPAHSGSVEVESEGAEWLLTYVGTEPPPAIQLN